MKRVLSQNEQTMKKAYELKLCSLQEAYIERMYRVYFEKYWKDDFVRYNQLIKDHQQQIRGARSMLCFSSQISEIKRVKQEESHLNDSNQNILLPDGQSEQSQKQSYLKDDMILKSKVKNESVTHMKKKNQVNVLIIQKQSNKKMAEKIQNVQNLAQIVNGQHIKLTQQIKVDKVEKRLVKQNEMTIDKNIKIEQKKQQQIIDNKQQKRLKIQTMSSLKDQIQKIQEKQSISNQVQVKNRIQTSKDDNLQRKRQQNKKLKQEQKCENELKKQEEEKCEKFVKDQQQQQQEIQEVVQEFSPSYYTNILKDQKTNINIQKEQISKENQNDSNKKEESHILQYQNNKIKHSTQIQEIHSEKSVSHQQNHAVDSKSLQKEETSELKQESCAIKEIDKSDKINNRQSISINQKNEIVKYSRKAIQSQQGQQIQQNQPYQINPKQTDSQLNSAIIDNYQESRYLTCQSFEIQNQLQNKQSNNKFSQIESCSNIEIQEQSINIQKTIDIESKIQSLCLEFQKEFDNSVEELSKKCSKFGFQYQQIKSQKEELKRQIELVGQKYYKIQYEKAIYQQKVKNLEVIQQLYQKQKSINCELMEKIKKLQVIEQLHVKQKNNNFNLMVRIKALENQVKTLEQKDIFIENNHKKQGIKRSLSQKLIQKSRETEENRNNVTAIQNTRKQEDVDYQSEKNSSDYQQIQKQQEIEEQSGKNSSDISQKQKLISVEKIVNVTKIESKENLDESRSQSSQK